MGQLLPFRPSDFDGSYTLNLSRLSDMELMQRLSETDEKLAALEDDPGAIAPVRKFPRRNDASHARRTWWGQGI